MSWTTPDQIAAGIEKRWRRGDILAARVTGEPLFPLRVRLRGPSAREIAERFGDWLARYPLTVLDHAAHWGEVLAVLDWFTAHPRPGLYLRQLDIPGVDTKFIETHRALLSELLDLVLPEAAIDRAAVGARAFNERYGLRSERPLVRFRLLDPALYLQGLSDLSLPPEQFASLRLPPRRVFITENRTNGLAFPDCPGSMVVFGLGYGLERLAEVGWLRSVEVHYWGDIDTHAAPLRSSGTLHLDLVCGDGMIGEHRRRHFLPVRFRRLAGLGCPDERRRCRRGCR